MNNLAISPYIGLHALQIQNVKWNTVKKVDIKEYNNPPVDIKPIVVDEEVATETVSNLGSAL